MTSQVGWLFPSGNGGAAQKVTRYATELQLQATEPATGNKQHSQRIERGRQVAGGKLMRATAAPFDDRDEEEPDFLIDPALSGPEAGDNPDRHMGLRKDGSYEQVSPGEFAYFEQQEPEAEI